MEFEKEWKDALQDDFKSAWCQNLKKFLKEEFASHRIFPPKEKIFEALNLTPLSKVKVVVLGQDPYHGEGQAHGLCFSVKNGNPPPSLQNIYKEIESDVGCVFEKSGDLTHWAKQGVLLLNTILTVRQGSPNSHKGQGWGNFTHAVIKALAKQDRPIVFLLWGNNAKSFSDMLTNPKHLVLTAPHPSPFSAHTGFFGCKHFSKTNEFLTQNGC